MRTFSFPLPSFPVVLLLTASTLLAGGCPGVLDVGGEPESQPETEPESEPSADAGVADGGQPEGAVPEGEPDIAEPAPSPASEPSEPAPAEPAAEPPVEPDPVPTEDTQALCTDGEDNDGDSDRDCADSECFNIAPCGQPETNEATCTDGLDNDNDGYFDCVDFDCDAVYACTIDENSLEACRDGIDNDGDGYTDCVDFGCDGQAVCSPNEDTTVTCTDEADNDDDGDTDCADSDCAALSVCQTNEDDAATCRDGVDNDSDGDLDCADSNCSALPICNRDELRVVAFNIQEVGIVGTGPYAALVRILARLNGDVVCLTEVDASEADALSALATATGYPYFAQAGISTPMAGGLTNACLSRFPILTAESRSSDDISPDFDANETGRDILLIRVDVAEASAPVTALVVHYKSGFDHADFFRREVEALRTTQLLEQSRARFPGDAFLVMGDVNEDVATETAEVYNDFPFGMPFSYRFGSDLDFPVTYGPHATLAAAGLTTADATWEDSATEAGTRYASDRRIDYILFDGLTLLADEVYDPCRDNGVDDPPVGQFMQKAGDPLECADGERASDHRPVMADFALP